MTHKQAMDVIRLIDEARRCVLSANSERAEQCLQRAKRIVCEAHNIPIE